MPLKSSIFRRRLTWLMCVGAMSLTALPALAQSDDVEAEPYLTRTAESGGVLEGLMFYAVAIGTVVSALGVCVSKNVVRMAVWLFCALGGVAMIYFLLAATFLGAIQLIVYAGGTLILLVFGVMLTSKSPWARYEISRLEFVLAGIVSLGLLGALCGVILNTTWTGEVMELAGQGTSVASLGKLLLGRYLVPFEAAGVLLMIVMVGAAHLARQEKN